ncbi:hypothetical protein Tco_0749256 [Tanacetum coccineum]|uniref:Uncharacterized protein n=1 Tax=Tanacetum coccineum TaxID=301880 RepID=A0ABQ4YYW8_9ASTR
MERYHKLYDASCLDDSKIHVNVRDTEDILDNAAKSQIKMKKNSQDPIAIERKQNVWTIDYKKLNALYEDFVPQKEFSVEHKYFSSSFISSENSSNASSLSSSFRQKQLWHQCQHEKERQKCESSLKNVCETSWISKMEKLESENVSLNFNAASSVRRPLNRDSPLKNSVLSNAKKSSEKVEVFVKKYKKTYVTSKNIVSDKKIVTNVDVQNALKAKDVLCVSCAKNMLIPCHDKCLAKYKLNVHSKVRRALFTTPRKSKSTFEDTTHVVSKTRFSVQTTQSKSLDTTPVVSRTKIAAVTPVSDQRPPNQFRHDIYPFNREPRG